MWQPLVLFSRTISFAWEVNLLVPASLKSSVLSKKLHWGTGSIAQWQGPYVTYTKPWVLSRKKEEEEEEKEKERKGRNKLLFSHRLGNLNTVSVVGSWGVKGQWHQTAKGRATTVTEMDRKVKAAVKIWNTGRFLLPANQPLAILWRLNYFPSFSVTHSEVLGSVEGWHTFLRDWTAL